MPQFLAEALRWTSLSMLWERSPLNVGIPDKFGTGWKDGVGVLDWPVRPLWDRPPPPLWEPEKEMVVNLPLVPLVPASSSETWSPSWRKEEARDRGPCSLEDFPMDEPDIGEVYEGSAELDIVWSTGVIG